MAKLDELKNIEFKDRSSLRNWLEKNHDKSEGIFLVMYKKDSGHPTVKYDEAVDEALCFGWIDSKINKVDKDRYKILYTPRKEKSIWSAINKKKVQKLKKEGLMTEAGRRLIEAAKENGYWSIYDSVEKLEKSKEFQEALNKNKDAKNFYENVLSDSMKKGILWMIKSAKTTETKRKRIERIINKLNNQEKPY